MSELRDSPVFIAGHPKSGTSLLRSVLDSHPELVAYPEETSFFRRYLPKTSRKKPAAKDGPLGPVPDPYLRVEPGQPSRSPGRFSGPGLFPHSCR